MRAVRGSRRWLFATVAVVSALALLPGAPAAAHGSGPEYLYAPTDAYLAGRVQEVTDTSDVLLAVEFRTTVGGTVSGIRICLDLTQQQVNARLPLLGNLWTADVNCSAWAARRRASASPRPASTTSR